MGSQSAAGPGVQPAALRAAASPALVPDADPLVACSGQARPHWGREAVERLCQPCSGVPVDVGATSGTQGLKCTNIRALVNVVLLH